MSKGFTANRIEDANKALENILPDEGKPLGRPSIEKYFPSTATLPDGW